MTSPSHSIQRLLLAALRSRTTPAAWTWLQQATERIAQASIEELLNAYTAAARRVGRGALALDEAEQRQARIADPGLSFVNWALEDAARAVLLLVRGATANEEDFVAAAIVCYERGDSREQQSWLRAVGLLPYGDRFAPTVIDACRTNILPLFEAIACENPYPARCFSDLHFNQMVLKALFNSVGLSRIVDLPSRLNAELTRMAFDYASERTAAHRAVPADISLAIGGSRIVQEQFP